MWMDKRTAARKNLAMEFKDKENKSELPEIDISELDDQLCGWSSDLASMIEQVIMNNLEYAQGYLDQALLQETELRQIYCNAKNNRYPNSKEVMETIQNYLNHYKEDPW
jgi:hypothetical protein